MSQELTEKLKEIEYLLNKHDSAEREVVKISHRMSIRSIVLLIYGGGIPDDIQVRLVECAVYMIRYIDEPCEEAVLIQNALYEL